VFHCWGTNIYHTNSTEKGGISQKESENPKGAGAMILPKYEDMIKVYLAITEKYKQKSGAKVSKSDAWEDGTSHLEEK
jgi:hypothetical protein